MLRQTIFASMLLAAVVPAFAAGTNANTQQLQHLIELFQRNNQQAISQAVRYPLNREAPIPAINSPAEMLKRFDQVFDHQLKQKIARSAPQQWQEMGWRGWMLDNGAVWFDGEKITAVNYSSSAEQQYKEQLIGAQKKALYPALRNLKAPVLNFKTQSYAVRIDELNNGKYRYASWKANKPQSAKPDLILNQGSVRFDGSGGNHSYHFTNGPYLYTVTRQIMGETASPDAGLTVYKSGRLLLRQSGILIDSTVN